MPIGKLPNADDHRDSLAFHPSQLLKIQVSLICDQNPIRKRTRHIVKELLPAIGLVVRIADEQEASVSIMFPHIL